MITKTYTYVSFYYTETDFEYQKKFEDELAYYCNSQQNVNLEEYLQQLVLLKPLIESHKVEKIAVFHTMLYDYQCNSEFSPSVMALINELKATFCISTDRTGEASLYHTLDKMRERPAMYLGEATLSALSHFISGFYEGCNAETNDEPSFDGFNDFVGNYYGKYTTAGWKNLILADHFGNEKEALHQFYELLDEFRLNEKKPNARNIVFKLLQMSFIDFRAETGILTNDVLSKEDLSGNDKKEIRNQLQKINRISDMLHNVPFQLTNAVFSNKIYYYEEILQEIFERANANKGLYELIKNNIPTAVFYEYELWSGDDGGSIITTCLKANHLPKDTILDECEKLIKTFYAINQKKAKEIKEAFMGF